MRNPLPVNVSRVAPGAARLFCWGLVGLLLLACERQPQPEMIYISGQTMGSSYHITAVRQPHQADAAGLQPLLEQRLAQLDLVFSQYRPDSELSKLNNDQKKTKVTLSPELAQVLAASLLIGQASGGALDVTLGPVIDLWGFGKDAALPRRPDPAALAQARARSGLDKIKLQGRELEYSHPAVELNFNAIAPGFAADEIAGLLIALDYSGFLVDIGGELIAHGTKLDGSPWVLGIERPDPIGRKVYKKIALTNKALATSGDYRNFFEEAGHRYQHSLNPQTGEPVTHQLASVSVIHDSVMMADGWATAIMVLGPEAGLKLAEAQGLGVFLIWREGAELKEGATTRFLQFASWQD